jgi:hypothetical protein
MRTLSVAIVVAVLCGAAVPSPGGHAQSANAHPDVLKLLEEARAATRAWMEGNDPLVARRDLDQTLQLFRP